MTGEVEPVCLPLWRKWFVEEYTRRGSLSAPLMKLLKEEPMDDDIDDVDLQLAQVSALQIEIMRGVDRLNELLGRINQHPNIDCRVEPNYAGREHSHYLVMALTYKQHAPTLEEDD